MNARSAFSWSFDGVRAYHEPDRRDSSELAAQTKMPPLSSSSISTECRCQVPVLRTGKLIYTARLEMRTLVRIADFKPSLRTTIAPVWWTGRFGIVGRSRTSEIRTTLDDLFARFLNDYLAVNPKR